MALVSTERWESLERWRSTAFLIAGVVFVADAAIVASNVAAGTERFMTLGQAFIGAAWTAAFLGLLGFYPDLADRSRWLPRIGPSSPSSAGSPWPSWPWRRSATSRVS